ncbi:TIGR04219 family outer membrane beta-barrel protein [Parahaliea sp. F7430]|uniref:TIGR04219 family outer membrane beta-barrel protein n=1 Tax=Sediminihaliea albiluteola TaxID=2758564 RepID=A0A7W2TWG2_9GAMM|nr:TIGR04219 family outer membrane beta-barrel protein [Sediminihaliea albiluteola]MBA6413099.1 TIGR04219 family outer membrane beta-barrel protein [Sediminihaliea albiluteola]
MKQYLFALLLSVVSASTWADALAVKGSLSSWWAKGEAADFSASKEQQWSATAAFEHPIPLIPNVKLRYLDYAEGGSQGMSLTTVDTIAYYEVLDNFAIDLDLGLAATRFQNGKLGGGRSFDGWIPQLYGALRVPLPLTGFGVYGEATATSFDDSEAYDIEAGVDYLIDMPVLDISLRLAYRQIENDFDDFDKFSGKLEFSGWSLGVLIDL